MESPPRISSSSKRTIVLPESMFSCLTFTICLALEVRPTFPFLVAIKSVIESVESLLMLLLVFTNFELGLRLSSSWYSGRDSSDWLRKSIWSSEEEEVVEVRGMVFDLSRSSAYRKYAETNTATSNVPAIVPNTIKITWQ